MNKYLKMGLQLFSTSIFELVTAQETASYWTESPKYKAPYLGEELFPADKQLGTEIRWVKGGIGAPKFLKPSGVDAPAIPRERAEFDKVITKLGFFKESLYIDENLRQQLNLVIASGNQQMIDAVLNKIFDDNAKLIEAARVTREILRMQLLMTGTATIKGNGQEYELDYGFKEGNKATAKVSWSDHENADPIQDITDLMDKIELETGERPTRAVTNLATFKHIIANKTVRDSIVSPALPKAIIGRNQVLSYISTELGLTVVIYDKMYQDSEGASTKFITDNRFSLLPAGTIGQTVFATTPEESDLMNSNVANVAVVDTGVAVTTMQKADPVQVETKVTMNSLPTFEGIDLVGIIDTVAQP
ncbi:major capsid protein [Enterococcus olivae]